MSLTMRWVGNDDDLDRVAETRLRCSGATRAELDRYKVNLRTNPLSKPGDFLLAEEAGEPVGGTTALSFTTWLRGSPLPCQGVAWVGTVRTRRRAGAAGRGQGIASQLMHETLRKARERGEVLSALMPFRASFYEHFGYGVVERRVEWNVPLAVLPQEPATFAYATDADRPAINELHARCVRRGQCDMERSIERWHHIGRQAADGWEVIERAADGRVTAYAWYGQLQQNGKDYLRVELHLSEDPTAFRRLLGFFASLRDQYFGLRIVLPADLPLPWLLRERQVPHRLVNHPAPEMRSFTRMQVRILDHRRTLEAMQLPTDLSGEAVIAVRETEGTVSKFRVRLEVGRAAVTPSDATPDAECADTTWAAVALGELPPDRAAEFGLLAVSQLRALPVLRAFAAGPVPFCEEYF